MIREAGVVVEEPPLDFSFVRTVGVVLLTKTPGSSTQFKRTPVTVVTIVAIRVRPHKIPIVLFRKIVHQQNHQWLLTLLTLPVLLARLEHLFFLPGASGRSYRILQVLSMEAYFEATISRIESIFSK